MTPTPKGLCTNIPLAPYTTFNIGGPGEFFLEVDSLEALHEGVTWAKAHGHHITILGGGSNVLIADSGVRGLVLHMTDAHITYEPLAGSEVRVTAGAGVVLDTLIEELVTRGLWGLENLSHIPGSVGATPVQNVGAYGVEVKDVIECVRVYDMETGRVETLDTPQCRFSYRDSLMKHEEGKQYIVTEVVYRVSSIPRRVPLRNELASYWAPDHAPTLRELRDAVIAIRNKKLPDWHVIGTAGSFFKNPVVPQDTYDALKSSYPELPGFREPNGMVKLSLGWILDHMLGMKGAVRGNVGLYKDQALVMVNHGGATAREVEEFAQTVSDLVRMKTGLHIEREVILMS